MTEEPLDAMNESETVSVSVNDEVSKRIEISNSEALEDDRQALVVEGGKLEEPEAPGQVETNRNKRRRNGNSSLASVSEAVRVSANDEVSKGIEISNGEALEDDTQVLVVEGGKLEEPEAPGQAEKSYRLGKEEEAGGGQVSVSNIVPSEDGVAETVGEEIDNDELGQEAGDRPGESAGQKNEDSQLMMNTAPIFKQPRTVAGRIPAQKKPEARDPNKRDMTSDEKQKLSANLGSLPSEMLDDLVPIIKKRFSALGQPNDEIEVDIDTVDAETLWEIDRFVTNYKKSKNKRKAEAGVVQTTSLTKQNTVAGAVEMQNETRIGENNDPSAQAGKQ